MLRFVERALAVNPRRVGRNARARASSTTTLAGRQDSAAATSVAARRRPAQRGFGPQAPSAPRWRAAHGRARVPRSVVEMLKRVSSTAPSSGAPTAAAASAPRPSADRYSRMRSKIRAFSARRAAGTPPAAIDCQESDELHGVAGRARPGRSRHPSMTATITLDEYCRAPSRRSGLPRFQSKNRDAFGPGGDQPWFNAGRRMIHRLSFRPQGRCIADKSIIRLPADRLARLSWRSPAAYRPDVHQTTGVLVVT